MSKNEWKTGISTAYWAKYINDKEHKNVEAYLCLGAEKPHPVSWLDELFRGGLPSTVYLERDRLKK